MAYFDPTPVAVSLSRQPVQSIIARRPEKKEKAALRKSPKTASIIANKIPNGLPSISALFLDFSSQTMQRTNTDETLVNPAPSEVRYAHFGSIVDGLADGDTSQSEKSALSGKRKRKSAGWSSELRRTKSHACEECGARFGSKQVLSCTPSFFSNAY